MQLFHKFLAVALCSNLTCPPPGAAQVTPEPAEKPASHAKLRQPYHSTQLQGDARILHALNRFTFGPRPGDLEAVRAIGLEKWFDQQLHPDKINQSDLTARLGEFPAMRWSTEDLLFRAPSNGIIRQAMDGKLSIPERGALHSVYEDQIYRVSERKQQQELKKANDAAKQQALAPSGRGASVPAMTGEGSMAAGSTTSANSQAPASAGSLSSDVAQNTMATPDSGPPPFDDAKFHEIVNLPPQQRVSRLIAMPPEEFESFIKSLKGPQRATLLAGLSPNLREVIFDLENPERMVAEEVIAQRLTRDIYSPAQLQEVMTDFWLNHFNVFLRKNGEMPYYLVSFERDVIRPRALGHFEDLLEATAHSPAMMLYLDNASSIGPDSLAAERAKFAAARRPDAKAKAREGLNENYARELMELHTLGVNGGYTQADVTQVARILTGWTVDRPQRGGEFRFEPNRHEPGTKIVMGKKFKERGELEGRELLHMLATHPSTARFISRKLAVRFVSDDPPQALVDRMAKTFLSTDGDISAVLTTLFDSPEFWNSDVYRAKVKTPVEFVVSAARAGNAAVDNLQPLANASREMGMPLYGCVTPNGYSWQSDTWVSTNALVNRMNFALSLAANRFPGITITWDPTQDVNADTTTLAANPDALPSPDAEESRLEAILLTGGVSDSTRSAVLQQFQQQSANTASALDVSTPARPRPRAQQVSALEKEDQLLAGLLLGSPEFQRR
jgi:uncharacterized protein (DUF1800 family)